MQKSLNPSQLVNTVNDLIKGADSSRYQFYYRNKNLPEDAQKAIQIISMGLDRNGIFFNSLNKNGTTIEIEPSEGFHLCVTSIKTNRFFRVYYQEDEGYRMLVKPFYDNVLAYIPEMVCDLRIGCVNLLTHEIITDLGVLNCENVGFTHAPLESGTIITRVVPMNINDYVSQYILPLVP